MWRRLFRYYLNQKGKIICKRSFEVFCETLWFSRNPCGFCESTMVSTGVFIKPPWLLQYVYRFSQTPFCFWWNLYLQKKICQETNEMPRSTQKNHGFHPHTHGVEVWVSRSIYKRYVFAKNCIKCLDLDRKLMFVQPRPIGGSGGQFTEKINISGWAHKSHGFLPCPMGCGWFWWFNLQKKETFAKNWTKFQICKENSCLLSSYSPEG